MSKEYVISKNYTNEIGQIGLSMATFSQIASAALEDCDNVKEAYTTRFKKSIVAKVVEKHLEITCNLLVRAGKNVNIISEEVQGKILDAVKFSSGVNNVVININVRGFYL